MPQSTYHQTIQSTLSQVDTSVVGLSSDLELAGMGPATNLCDSFLYMFTFLAVVRRPRKEWMEGVD